jgi:hypothetical protein
VGWLSRLIGTVCIECLFVIPTGAEASSDVQLETVESGVCFYIGQSDNIRVRLAAHRKAFPNRHKMRVVSALVAGLPHREKSTARRIEKELLNALISQVQPIYCVHCQILSLCSTTRNVAHAFAPAVPCATACTSIHVAFSMAVFSSRKIFSNTSRSGLLPTSHVPARP